VGRIRQVKKLLSKDQENTSEGQLGTIYVSQSHHKENHC
jgi:hypothetical protein